MPTVITIFSIAMFISAIVIILIILGLFLFGAYKNSRKVPTITTMVSASTAFGGGKEKIHLPEIPANTEFSNEFIDTYINS